MKYVYSVVLYLFSATVAFAWAPEQCAVFLKYGIYDEHDIVVFDQYFNRVKKVYCEKNSQNQNINISIPQMVDIGGNNNYQNEMCDSYDYEKKNMFYYNQTKKTINSQIINALKSCMAENEGFSYYIKTSSDPRSFSIQFRFAPYRILKDKIRIMVKGASCYSTMVDGEIKSDNVYFFEMQQGSYEYICNRNPSNQVWVSVSASESKVVNSNVELPAYKNPPPPPTEYDFYLPTVQGVPLDVCLTNSRSCGKPSADRWCLVNGFAEASSFQWGGASRVTRTLGDNFTCNSPPYTCGMIKKITCRIR